MIQVQQHADRSPGSIQSLPAAIATITVCVQNQAEIISLLSGMHLDGMLILAVRWMDAITEHGANL
jgi:hypothetical protein